MPGVVTLELAATPAAQRGQVETQTPLGDLKTLPSVHQEEELEPEEILMSPADFSLLPIPSMDGGRMWVLGES